MLGDKIFENDIEVDRGKIKTIEKLPPPSFIKSVRRFLGHARFYRYFRK